MDNALTLPPQESICTDGDDGVLSEIGEKDSSPRKKAKNTPTSTVGRGKSIVREAPPDCDHWTDGNASVWLGDALDFYSKMPAPTCIVSDGAYGVLGFEGDTSDHLGVPDWYEPHIIEWSRYATARTTLWFWNSEIGWATVHPILEKHGWRYVNANIWDKGMAHIAGNVNTAKIRRFPVVSEVCVQYVFEPRINGKLLKVWLLEEWKRTGLKLREANIACEVADVAVRKYLDQGHLWYWPPIEMFEKLRDYANKNGRPGGKPYFSLDGSRPLTSEEWAQTRSRFQCPHGITNVWQRGPLHGAERIKTHGSSGRAVHFNQKPLDLMSRIILASTEVGEVVWEPFGGLFTGCVAARKLDRKAYSVEIDPTYFHYGVERLKQQSDQGRLL